MKKILLAAATVALSLMMLPAHAEGDWVETGSILVGDVLSPVGALTQDCTGATNGVDTHTAALPAGVDGLPITATTNDSDINDVDLYFYDASCTYMPGVQLNATGDEAGEVPEGAAYVEADLYVGANATVTITVEGGLA